MSTLPLTIATHSKTCSSQKSTTGRRNSVQAGAPRILRALILGILSCGLLSTVQAQIVFTNTTVDSSGSGFGSVINLLTVQKVGTEFGSILLDADGNDVESGDAKNTSQTVSVETLGSAGLSSTDFNIIFNISQNGSDPSNEIVLNDFSLRFYADVAGDPANASFFDLTYDAPDGGLSLPMIGNGTGAAGWLFTATFTPQQATDFFGSSTNRVGQIITSDNAIGNSNDGQENFFLVAVPEPATVGLVVLGGLAFWITRRRRQAAAA